MNTQHTPAPWWIKDDESVYSGDGVIVRTNIGESTKRNTANAAFIVHAVNAYQIHVDLLKELLCELDPNCRLDGQSQNQEYSWRDNLIIEIYDAIAKAEGR